MSTSTALAATAVAVSIDAKEDAACTLAMAGYTHDDATVAEMQEYAECVQRVHPGEMPDTDVLVIKVIICVLLLGAAVGAVRGFFSGGTVEAFLEAGFYAVMTAAAAGGLGLLGYGLWFLFTA